MQQASAISRSSYDGRTLGVAAWILGIAALAEIVCASVALVDRARHNPPLTIHIPPEELIVEASPGPPIARPAPSFGDPFASITASTPAPAPTTAYAAAATPAPAATPAEAAAPPKPTPVPEEQITTPQSRLDGLVAEAMALRTRGDTSTAVTRLREALALSPNNPLVISELAKTYEKMDLDDKALEQWRAIYDMGEQAGIYYTAAEAKLNEAKMAEAAPSAGPDAGTDDGSFQPGSSLALVNLSTVEKPETTEGYKRFTLKIPVKRRPDVKINVSSVKINVFFYEQMANGDIVPTNASLSDHWNSLPANFVNEDIEILDVDYAQAAPQPDEVAGSRRYYGYIVCVYYNRALQDKTADPPSLIKAFPPPLVLSDQVEAKK